MPTSAAVNAPPAPTLRSEFAAMFVTAKDVVVAFAATTFANDDVDEALIPEAKFK